MILDNGDELCLFYEEPRATATISREVGGRTIKAILAIHADLLNDPIELARYAVGYLDQLTKDLTP